MISVGVFAANQMALGAIRSVLTSSKGINVIFAECCQPEGNLRIAGRDADVLLCERTVFRILVRLLEDGGHRMDGEKPRILCLGNPPSEGAFRAMIRAGVSGFVGATAADFGALPEAIRVAASGQFYLPSEVVGMRL